MIVRHFTRILYISGAITMLPIVMFFIPWAMFSLTGISVGNGAGVAFVKHWGLMAFCFGALLVYAASHVEARRPIVIAVGIEKMGLCVIVLAGWGDAFMTALRPAATSIERPSDERVKRTTPSVTSKFVRLLSAVSLNCVPRIVALA